MSRLGAKEAANGLFGATWALRGWAKGPDRARIEAHFAALAGLIGEIPTEPVPCGSPAEAIELVGQVEALLCDRVVPCTLTSRHEREAIAALGRVAKRALEALPFIPATNTAPAAAQGA